MRQSQLGRCPGQDPTGGWGRALGTQSGHGGPLVQACWMFPPLQQFHPLPRSSLSQNCRLPGSICAERQGRKDRRARRAGTPAVLNLPLFSNLQFTDNCTSSHAWDTKRAKHFMHISKSTLTTTLRDRYSFYLLLQLRKLRHRVVQKPTQGHREEVW